MHVSTLRKHPSGAFTCGVIADREAVAKDEAGVFKCLLEQFPPQTSEEAAKLLVDLIDKASRETSGGEFINVDGTKLPW